MSVALDTDAYSDFLRGVPERVRVVRTAERIYVPLIVLGELRAGFAAGSREGENVETLRKFLASARVSVFARRDDDRAFRGDLRAAPQEGRGHPDQ